MKSVSDRTSESRSNRSVMKWHMRCPKLIALASLLFSLSIALSANSLCAASFKITELTSFSQDNVIFGVLLSEIQAEIEAMVSLDNSEISEDRQFTLDRETGEIIFGDGLIGKTPPPGTGSTVAAYRYGAGSSGTILDPFLISLDFFPAFIPFDDPLTDGHETEIRFFFFGISSFEFEVISDGVWVTSIRPVPEPSTILLLGSGLLCLAGSGRKKFFKK